MNQPAVAIGGVGLLGGSLALALRRRRICGRIAGTGRSPARLARMKKKRLIDEGFDDPAEGVRGADWIFVCTPVQDILPWIERASRGLKPGALVMDVGSVKEALVAPAERICSRAGAHFIGCHPMAGSEKTGFQHARQDLYQGRTVAVTPTSHSDPSALKRAEEIWRRLGARTIRLQPRRHDATVAATSHLPHLAACAVASAVIRSAPAGSGPVFKAMAGEGLKDTTRIAGSDGRLWAGIFANNRPALLKALGCLKEQIARIERPLRRGGRSMEKELTRVLEDSRLERLRMFPE